MKPSPLTNLLWLLGERMARVGLTATVFALVARHLAPASFAQLNLATTLVALAAAFANLGLEGLVVHELIRQPTNTGRVLGTALHLRLAASVAALVAVFLLGAGVSDWRPALLPIFLSGLSLLFGPAEVIDLCFQRHLQSRRTVVARSVAVVLGAGLRLGLIAANASVAAFAAVIAIEGAALAVLLIVSWRRSGFASGAWSWDGVLARQFVARGFPLALSGVAVALALRADQLLVLSWLGRETAGVYFAAAKLAETVLLAGAAFTLSLFPRLSESHATDGAAYSARLQATFDAMSALGWAIAIGATVLAPWGIPWLFGEAYAEAAPVVMVQSWGVLVALNAAARWQFILISAPTWVNLLCAALGIATQMALAPWLLPKFGAIGAAVGWTCAVIVSGWLTTFAIPSLRPAARAQTRALLIPFAPGRWRALVAQFL